MSQDYLDPSYYFHYPFRVEKEIDGFIYTISCRMDSKIIWKKRIQYPRDPITNTTTDITFEFIWCGHWMVITNDDISSVYIQKLKDNVGDDPLIPNIWLKKDTIPVDFVKQAEKVRVKFKEIMALKLQDHIEREVEKYGLKHNFISDGHHTFDELYQYRMAFHALTVNGLPSECEAHKSLKHYDGKECFAGDEQKWFVVSCKLNGKLVSNHYKFTQDNWDLFKIPEEETEKWPFDPTETPQKQLQNMMDYLLDRH